MRIDGVNGNLNYSSFDTSMDTREKRPVDSPTSKLKLDREEKDLKEKEEKYSERDIKDIIEKANDDFVIYDRRFEFSVHEKTKKISVKVLDTVTDEVIREIPPEKILDLVAGIWEMAGIIVDKKI